MRYFAVILVLAITVALVKPQSGGAGGSVGASGSGQSQNGGAGGSGQADGSVQVGGCSAGASGSGSADGSKGSSSGSASANCGTPASGYAYVINATRTDNVFPGGGSVAYMYYKVEPTQNLTYFRAVGPDYPLMIEGYIANGDTVYFSNNESSLLNACNTYQNGTWEYLLIEIVKKGMIPDGSCSAQPGNYEEHQIVSPISVSFPQMIKCGVYNIIYNALVTPTDEDKSRNGNSDWTWAWQLDYSFEIPDDGNCN